MKHPNSEEWMSFLYQEDAPTRHAEMRTHLRNCAECAGHVAVWRDSMQLLDQWPRGAARRSGARRRTVLKWAAAAALVAGLSLGIGRALQPPPMDVAALKTELRRDFDARLAAALASSNGEVRRLLTDFKQAQDERHALDLETIMAALRQLDASYAANVAALRAELETVAVNTQDGLSQAHQQLGLLASYTQPLNPSEPK